MKNIRLGDVLIEFGYITPDQLNTALAYQKEHRDLRVGQALQELGYVNERQVLEALAQRLQLTMIAIEHTNVDVTAVEKVPQELAQKYDMLPIAQSPRALTIAANDPLNYYAIEDIRQNYAGLYGVEELSERLGVSKSHLVRTFTAAVGVPPGRYLTTVRIEAAMRLLLHREYTLDVIASLCGFSGANYLCRVFKKETGHSPAQWRAMAGQAVRPLSPAESKREQELYI